MLVNMLGYSVGVGGVSQLFNTAWVRRTEAVQIFVGAYAALFCGVQVMFEIRHLESVGIKRHLSYGVYGSNKEVPKGNHMIFPGKRVHAKFV